MEEQTNVDLFKLSGACLCPCSEHRAHGAERLGLVVLMGIDMMATATLEANYQLFSGCKWLACCISSVDISPAPLQ